MISSDADAEFLLDTNILIYLAKEEEHILSFMRERRGTTFGISVISYMEVLVGARNDRELSQLQEDLSIFIIVPLSQAIAGKCVETLRERSKSSLRDPHFLDLLIAHTALDLGVPLITNNPRDFRKFKGLEILVP